VRQEHNPDVPHRNKTVQRALLALVAVFMVPTLLSAIGAILYVYKEEQVRFQDNLVEATRALSLVVDRELSRREAIARTLAASPTLTQRDLAAFYDYAREVTPTRDSVVVLHALNGAQLVNTRVPFGTTLPQTSALNPERAAAGPLATVVSNLYVGSIGNRHSFAVQVPVLRGGEPIYYLSLASFATHLQSILEDQKLPAGWVASILDRNRVIVTRNRDAQEFVGKKGSPLLLAQLDQNEAGVFHSTSIDGTPTLASYHRSPTHGWVVAVGVPMSRITPPMQAALMFGALALLLLGGAMLAALQVGRRLVMPVQRLHAASQSIGRGENLTLEPTGLRETDQVLQALHEANQRINRSSTEMAARVESAVAEADKAHRAVIQSQRLEALGQLTGGVAHDFNNLLMVVRTNLHLLKSRLPEGVDRTPLERIERATDTGAQLTRQLLAFARRQPLRPEIIDLRSRLPDLAALIRPALGSHVDMHCEVAEDVPRIVGDPAEFELALINMSMNARDAMPDGGHLSVRARLSTPQEAAEACAVIEVADTGQGIAPDLLERVFEPFFTTKPVGHGTGLGLSQVHGFVTQAGGTVRVTSEPGKGTCLTLLIPAAAISADVDHEPTATPVQAPGGQGRRVLLVEDNEDVASATADLLREAGYVVDHAPNGDEAKALLGLQASYECVLSDIRMPGQTDGIALAEWLSGRHPGLPIILTTGYSQELRQAFKLGLEVLPKPSSPDALLGALDQACAGRAAVA